MPKTFWADCTVDDGYNTDTASYIDKEWGIKLRVQHPEHPSDQTVNYLGITVRDCPDIMTEIENSGYFEPRETLWQVNRISKEGISLYLVNYGGKSEDAKRSIWEEVFIFIPMSNVIAVHNVSQQFFINESLRRIEREETCNDSLDRMVQNLLIGH